MATPWIIPTMGIHHAQEVAEPVLAHDVENNVVLPERPDGPEQPERPEEPNPVSHPGGQCDLPNRYEEGEEDPVLPSEACVRMIIHVPYGSLDPPHTAFFAVGRSWPNDGKCWQNAAGREARAS